MPSAARRRRSWFAAAPRSHARKAAVTKEIARSGERRLADVNELHIRTFPPRRRGQGPVPGWGADRTRAKGSGAVAGLAGAAALLGFEAGAGRRGVVRRGARGKQSERPGRRHSAAAARGARRRKLDRDPTVPRLSVRGSRGDEARGGRGARPSPPPDRPRYGRRTTSN